MNELDMYRLEMSGLTSAVVRALGLLLVDIHVSGGVAVEKSFEETSGATIWRRNTPPAHISVEGHALMTFGLPSRNATDVVGGIQATLSRRGISSLAMPVSGVG